MGQTCSHCCGSTRPELDATNMDLKEKLLDNNHQLNVMEDPSQSMERALTIQKSKKLFEGHGNNSMNLDDIEGNQYEDEVRRPSAASRVSRNSRSSRNNSVSSRKSSQSHTSGSSYNQQRTNSWDAAADSSHHELLSPVPTTTSTKTSSSKNPSLSSNIQSYDLDNEEEDVDNDDEDDEDLSDEEIKRVEYNHDDSYKSVSRLLSASSSPQSQDSQRSISEDSYASTRDVKRIESRGLFDDDGSSIPLQPSAGGRDPYDEKVEDDGDEDDFANYDDKGRYVRGKSSAQNPNTSFADSRSMLDHYNTNSNASGDTSDSDDPY